MLESLSKYFKNIISINFDNNVNFHKFLNIYENIDFNYNDSIFDIKYEFLKSLDINLENLYKKINKERFYYEYISNILYQNYNFAKIEKNVTKVEENFLFPFKYKDPFLKKLNKLFKKAYKKAKYEMPEKPILILKKIKEGYSNKGILMKTSLILFYDFLLTIKIMFIENVRTLSLFESKELCLIIKDLFDNNTFILNYFGFTIKKFDELLKYMNYDFNILILLLNPLYILNEFFNFTNDQFTLDNARKIINDNCIIYLNDKLKFFINKNNFQLIKLINNILNIDSLY